MWAYKKKFRQGTRATIVSTLNVVYRKLKAVGIWIFLHKEIEGFSRSHGVTSGHFKSSWNINLFLIRKMKGSIFASEILYSRIPIFTSRKYSEKSKVYHITWNTVTVVFTSDFYVGNDAQLSGLRHRFVRFDLYLIHQK